MSVGVMPLHPYMRSHIYWLGLSILIMPYQNHKDIVFTTHACHHLKAYTLMLGIMYKMLIAIKLSLFPLLNNKHCKKYFQKVDYQSALLFTVTLNI